ncbi:hypothetical protein LCGC14_0603310 [marine sediment metagenome]|uniref:Uncharacterized protein n=1 Tax=marine sediment metagenome TaxID=412755 RepID=A0A0F9TW41_9ZZZZ
MDAKEIFNIREEIIKIYENKFNKKPTKKQFIMEVLNHQDGKVNLSLLSKIINYNESLLKKWIMKLNVEHKISVMTDYKQRWVIVKKCEQKCEFCLQLVNEYSVGNLEVCEFCGHYYIQNKWDTGYCNSCDEGKKRGKGLEKKEVMDRKNIKELRIVISNFNRESSISGAESAVLNALSKLSDNYTWKVYLSIFKFIDSFLW